jgi:hypothetical protein
MSWHRCYCRQVVAAFPGHTCTYAHGPDELHAVPGNLPVAQLRIARANREHQTQLITAVGKGAQVSWGRSDQQRGDDLSAA